MEAEETVRHPIAARLIERTMRAGEKRGQAEHRRRLLAGLSGRIVELGAGSGINFVYYPDKVTEVVAVEPEDYLRRQAEKAAATASVPVRVVHGVSGSLPLDAASCDAGVACLVLCTVPDQQRALAELARVIRPGGELRFYEHVVAHYRFEARLQRLADATIWPRLAGGCHRARDTAGAIEGAGFRIESCDRFSFTPSLLLPPDPHILGIARRQ
ncbi:MAG TPA: class I SAM-dependent methyltransferase [Candidatus Dormibacteraeota bacterium]|nr:class I SAM-dependent methyltransferase [Candidatus Dormibacteraeota bacterium]